MAENEQYLSVRKCFTINLIMQKQIWRLTMKLLTILITATLLLVAASTVSAQNNLPDPNDAACWQSLGCSAQLRAGAARSRDGAG